MNPMYTCECADGRTITGASRWELNQLRQMNPLELAKVLTEQRDFSRYYEATFFYPAQSLQSEKALLQRKYERARNTAVFFGGIAGIFTLLWLLLAVLPFFRFSGLTMLMAILTLVSIVALIPFLFHFVSVQEEYSKRLPRVQAKMDRLHQREEKEIYGTYVEYLIGGYLLSPEYSLSSKALELMIQALSSRRASNLSEASLLCKKKFGKSPVPRLVANLRSLNEQAAPQRTKQEPETKRMDLSGITTQGPDIQVVLQLSEYLHTALKGFAANQPAASSEPNSIAATLTCEEEALIAEYRYLQDDEKKRIRRVVHSFHTKKY